MIARIIIRLKNPLLRRVLWLIWYPFEYVILLHDKKLEKNFWMWATTVFCLGWYGIGGKK